MESLGATSGRPGAQSAKGDGRAQDTHGLHSCAGDGGTRTTQKPEAKVSLSLPLSLVVSPATSHPLCVRKYIRQRRCAPKSKVPHSSSVRPGGGTQATTTLSRTTLIITSKNTWRAFAAWTPPGATLRLPHEPPPPIGAGLLGPAVLCAGGCWHGTKSVAARV